MAEQCGPNQDLPPPSPPRAARGHMRGSHREARAIASSPFSSFAPNQLGPTARRELPTAQRTCALCPPYTVARAPAPCVCSSRAGERRTLFWLIRFPGPGPSPHATEWLPACRSAGRRRGAGAGADSAPGGMSSAAGPAGAAAAAAAGALSKRFLGKW